MSKTEEMIKIKVTITAGLFIVGTIRNFLFSLKEDANANGCQIEIKTFHSLLDTLFVVEGIATEEYGNHILKQLERLKS